jgi:Zn-dependent protease/CBS domain-containing protein
MKWSWKLGSVAGIKIQVHWTFLILIAWVVLVHASQGASVSEVVGGVILVLAVFACVVLHELGHALTAKRFGVNTRDITLLPIGGVARLERMPEEPREELLVAVAGPAVNVVIAGVLFAVLAGFGTPTAIGEVAVVGGNLPVQLMWLNLMLVGFNVLPAFPMDGGRILRALLAMRMDYLRATRIAAGIGQMMAIVFGFGGLLMGNIFLLFIAIFVYLGAQAEAQHVQFRVALQGVSIGDAMMTRFRTLAPYDTLDDAVEELLAGAQQDFPVVADGRFVGMLFRNDLVTALKEHGGGKAVADVADTECRTVSANGNLQDALMQLRGGKRSSVPVIRDGQVVGILTLENVGEFMMVQSSGGAGASRLDEIFATE